MCTHNCRNNNNNRKIEANDCPENRTHIQKEAFLCTNVRQNNGFIIFMNKQNM